MSITLKQLQIFLAVARHENLAMASNELFLTKGAVSQGLQELERQLGIQLFDRIHPRLHLNHEGVRLRPLADEIVHRSQEVERMFRSEDAFFLNIGASKTIGTYVLPQLLKAFETARHWIPRAQIANSNQLLELTELFALDAVLLEGESTHPDMIMEKWMEDEMVVIAARDHPLADGMPREPEALLGQRWVLREPHSGTREFFEHTLGRVLAPYEIVQTLDSPEAVLGMVAQQIGLTFTSKIITELPEFDRQLACIPLTRRFFRTFFICYHTKKYHSVSMDQFLTFCRQWHAVPAQANQPGKDTRAW